MLTDKFLLLSSSFASKYFEKVEHFTNPANAGRIDDFFKEHFESKIAATKDIYSFDGTDAHIRISGPMSPEGPDLYDVFYGFGGVSYQDILTSIDKAKQDINPYKGKLYLHTDTPGGTVNMVDDVYQPLMICAFETVMLNKNLVASAGVWLGSACTRIVATTPAAFTGSIGVVVSCFDMTGFLERLSLKKDIIINHEASEKIPDISTDEGKKVIQEELGAIYSVFKERVVAGRDGKISAAMIDDLKGSVKIAADALNIGLIDAVDEVASLTLKTAQHQPRAQASAKPVGKGESDMSLTIEKLRADHADLVAVVEAEAREGMVTADDLQQQVADSREQGAADERARIQAVEEQLIPGHEALIGELKFDGKTTGPEAAQKVLAAEKSARASVVGEIDAETGKAVPAAEGGQESGVDSSAPIEERAKAEWDKDSDLRSEFGGKFESYLAFRKNEEAGRARVMKRS